MKKLLHTAALAATLVAAFASAPAWAQTATVKVEGAWARASVQGQKGTGAFMRLTAQDGARLVRYHVMLLDLKAPLAKDTVVPLTLVFQDAKGAESKLNISVPVATTPPGGAAPAGHGHGHKH